MSGDSWTEIGVAIGALVLMAVAAALGASATLISRQRLRQLAEQQGRQRNLPSLLDPRRTLIAALFIVQAIAIAVAASVLTTFARRQFGVAEHLIAVGVVGVVVLLFGQALPRALSLTQPERVGGVLLVVAGVLELLVRPLIAAVDATANLFARLLGGPAPDAVAGTEDELRAMAIEGPDDGLIEPGERRMIDNVLQLEETSARDIMVPRVDMVAIDETAPAEVILETITRAGHSRLPVYRESIDRIVGVLHAKDLLPFVIGSDQPLPLDRLIRPAFIVPESKRIDDLLTEFRRSRVHIAIVADEYGGTAGLVTIEDILEEIVGDIQDEYDVEVPLLEAVTPGVILADGRLPLEEVEEALGVRLDEEETSTVAGFVHRHLERLPEAGDAFVAQGLRVEVLTVEGHRIRALRISRVAEAVPVLPNAASPAADAGASADSGTNAMARASADAATDGGSASGVDAAEGAPRGGRADAPTP